MQLESSIPVTQESLGRRLRVERERRQLTLDTIAERTKISLGLLKGLERDDVSRWPSGVYRRAFVHAYATEIGMDAHAVIREFLECYGDPEAGTHPSPPVHFTGGLRLVLADTAPSFSGGRLLFNPIHRLAAAACDAALMLSIAGGTWALTGNFWTLAGLTAVVYSMTSVLVLGNTPGICLLASAVSHADVPPVEPDEDSPGLLTAPAITAISSSP